MNELSPVNQPNSQNLRISEIRKRIKRYELEGDEPRVLELEAELRALEKGEEFDRERYLQAIPPAPVVPTTRRYEYFDNEYSREDIFMYSKGMSEYILKNNIANIIFMDRAARPAWVGVDEYWNLKYKDIPKPSFYFVNPDGFMTDEFIEKAKNVSMIIENKLHDNISDDDVRKQLKSKYKALINSKDKPLLLFDTCSHSGDTLISVKRILGLEGFTDVRTATATSPDKGSRVKSVIRFDNSNFNSCMPFGLERSIKTTSQNIFSERSKEGGHRGRAIREDIRAIIREYA